MKKFENKFFALSILTVAGVFFSLIFIISYNLSLLNLVATGKMIPKFQKNKILLSRFENEAKDSRRIQQDTLRANFEHSIRNFGFPFSSKKAGIFLENKLGMKDLRIYDESYRLIYSGIADKEIFNKDLRFSNHPISPGTFSQLGDYNVYRSLDGLYFFRFVHNENPGTAKQLNIPFVHKYWIMDKKKDVLIFTNDIEILSGVVNEKDFHQPSNNGLQEIEGFSTDTYQMYYTDEIKPVENLITSIVWFFAGVISFICIGYFLLYNYLDWKEKYNDDILLKNLTDKVDFLEFLKRIENKLNREIVKHAE